ncbi:hypothetical protein PHIM7_214 [Sinorhizobium phage phiM7]|uniref:Uncharacterized protein n=2 Tax=Emdodecavirus TaxID=1980937 RepID=S5MVJ2_9CAUD|nr:hypothetical protein AB690_gp292 [Sinorhizobium phage phiM12]YP_009601339.1 hypothetical protein FDH46_gp264 [Sinorhizobium phage phiM7]AGR47917.1 hypothetical protein SmphiM12_285 [Sinorhizobium phage phiM12]AKF12759.1 hypothetical protein PHIM7_214 [Sinorhizobium phage phiM7]AKF13119.1 hypothetical protein PHIM19_214 [Sinorhizobium phage phiM19]
MSRSRYIYILEHETDIDVYELIAAFTVKHEALSFIDRNFEDKEPLRLYRIHDGSMDEPVYIDLKG